MYNRNNIDESMCNLNRCLDRHRGSLSGFGYAYRRMLQGNCSQRHVQSSPGDNNESRANTMYNHIHTSLNYTYCYRCVQVQVFYIVQFPTQLISSLMLTCPNSRANDLFSRSPLSRLACSIPLLASVPLCACAHEQTRDKPMLVTSSLTCMQACVLTGCLYL